MGGSRGSTGAPRDHAPGGRGSPSPRQRPRLRARAPPTGGGVRRARARRIDTDRIRRGWGVGAEGRPHGVGRGRLVAAPAGLRVKESQMWVGQDATMPRSVAPTDGMAVAPSSSGYWDGSVGRVYRERGPVGPSRAPRGPCSGRGSARAAPGDRRLHRGPHPGRTPPGPAGPQRGPGTVRPRGGHGATKGSPRRWPRRARRQAATVHGVGPSTGGWGCASSGLPPPRGRARGPWGGPLPKGASQRGYRPRHPRRPRRHGLGGKTVSIPQRGHTPRRSPYGWVGHSLLNACSRSRGHAVPGSFTAPLPDPPPPPTGGRRADERARSPGADGPQADGPRGPGAGVLGPGGTRPHGRRRDEGMRLARAFRYVYVEDAFQA